MNCKGSGRKMPWSLLSQNLAVGTEIEDHEPPVRAAGISAKIRSEDLQNTKKERYRYNNLLESCP
jgi:hypothetical protein